MYNDPQLFNRLVAHLPTIAMIGGLFYYQWNQDAEQDKAINAIEVSRVERSKEADQKFSNINNGVLELNTKIAPLDNIAYRVGVLEGSLSETNKRMDRLSESVINSMEGLKKDTNQLSTKIEVLTNEVRTLTGRNQTMWFEPMRKTK